MNDRTFKKEMKRIIKVISNGKEPDITSDFSYECLGTCVDDGYIIGYKVDRNANGNIVCDVSTPKVTLKGLSFIAPNIDWPQVISLLVAITAVIISVFK